MSKLCLHYFDKSGHTLSKCLVELCNTDTIFDWMSNRHEAIAEECLPQGPQAGEHPPDVEESKQPDQD